MQLSDHAQMLIGGEYALGLLPATASKRWERLMAAQPELAELTAHWQQQLAPLASWLPERAAPVSLWQSIEAELFGTSPMAQAPHDNTHSAMSRAATPITAAPKRRLTWWAAAAMAAGVSLWLALPSTQTIIAPHAPALSTSMQVIATLSSEQQEVQWQVNLIDGQSLELSASAPWTQPAERSLQLWALDATGTPHSLGVLTLRDDRATLALDATERELLLAATLLAISDEPAGGSPTALPTGPVIFTGKPAQG